MKTYTYQVYVTLAVKVFAPSVRTAEAAITGRLPRLYEIDLGEDMDTRVAQVALIDGPQL